jgi:hypothetical protein
LKSLVDLKVTINTLRKDLAIAREKCAEEVAKMTASLSTIQDENDRLKRLCESTALKDQQIFALEQTLYAQENMVERYVFAKNETWCMRLTTKYFIVPTAIHPFSSFLPV